MLWPILVGLIFLLPAACATTPVPRYSGAAPLDRTVYLISGGWHTELGLSRQAAAGNLPPALLSGFPEARYFAFGWGARGYYTALDPGLGDVLRALAPGPAVLLVIPLAAPPAAEFGAGNVLALAISEPGLARLGAYLSAFIARTGDGAPSEAARGPEPGSVFFASTGDYDAFHNCNTWTAEALQVAGLPVSAAGVLLASQVLDQARPLARPAGAFL